MSTSTSSIASAASAAARPRLDVRAAINRNKQFVAALAFFVVLLGVFIVLSPEVFLRWGTYVAVFVSLPTLVILAIPMVFVVTSGEIDLSFASTVGLSAFAFAHGLDAMGMNTWTATLFALVVGVACGGVAGLLVTRVGLSSLVATLGLYFLLRGLVQVLSNGQGVSLSYLTGGSFERLFVGRVGSIPVQMLWSLLFVALGIALWRRHRFGAHVCAIGDNVEAARAMGIRVNWVKSLAFVYVGASAAVVGILLVLINGTFFPTTGDSLLLTVIAAVFVGGTPTFGGVGTVAGAIVGAFTVGFIESGIIAVGLTGFWTQLFYGLVIILSLVGLRYVGRN